MRYTILMFMVFVFAGCASSKNFYKSDAGITLLVESGDEETADEERLLARPIEGWRRLLGTVQYPEEAIEENIRGTVEVALSLDATGSVAKMYIVKGIGGGCDQAAMDAVQKVQFEPAQVAGEAAASNLSLLFDFQRSKKLAFTVRKL